MNLLLLVEKIKCTNIKNKKLLLLLIKFSTKITFDTKFKSTIKSGYKGETFRSHRFSAGS